MSSSSSGIVMFCLCFCGLLILSNEVWTAEGVVELPNNEKIPAVIVFGDSIVDPGNNNNLITLIKCNFPPYGRDYMGGKPTGRFCNGKVPSDLIAQELGVRDIIPAYLDPNLESTDLLTGVSFASGATGFDPLTPKIPSVLSLSDQLNMFKEYTGKLKKIVGEEKTNDTLTRSLYLVVAGSDDIANTYYLIRHLEYDIASYTDLTANLASSFLKKLYKLGARRIAVFGAPPLGCLPSRRTLSGGLLRECSEEYNQAGQLFNSKLSAKLDSLNRDLPRARMVYIDIYNPLLDLIQNPSKSGFEVVDKGCCGTGTIEVVVLCNELNPFTCSNVSRYIFWDSYHPTEKAYKILIDQLLQKYIRSFF
ncbi:GDSL esterase/lipase EXL3-like [Malania oleifera]|uniref:GDSL esterase/lipase EXL3-like n=1 Tax=Malania oleifera TaxID=397392 RepID=UPI0025AEA379|nr:GDSL esterase/lipase EXL3-like [Malania oleifera]